MGPQLKFLASLPDDTFVHVEIRGIKFTDRTDKAIAEAHRDALEDCLSDVSRHEDEDAFEEITGEMFESKIRQSLKLMLDIYDIPSDGLIMKTWIEGDPDDEDDDD